MAIIALIVALGAGAGLAPVPASAATPAPCISSTSRGPLWVTADCVDPLYNRPVIDSETDLEHPFALHKVSGHFEGTTSRFNFYFPQKDKWQGRFFQMAYPLGDGNATDGVLLAGADAGAYTVQTSGALGYRLDAAAAKFSRTIAARFYGSGEDQIYGYLYGGSGGSYQVIGGIENSVGVWDGAVPFVIAAPTSLPNNFFIRAFARTVLEDKAEQIADAVRPGEAGIPTRISIPLRDQSSAKSPRWESLCAPGTIRHTS
ncbi:hypothetical protein ACW0JT_18485 [Arthrobacter sp. SA17]